MWIVTAVTREMRGACSELICILCCNVEDVHSDCPKTCHYLFLAKAVNCDWDDWVKMMGSAVRWVCIFLRISTVYIRLTLLHTRNYRVTSPNQKSFFLRKPEARDTVTLMTG